ncbi:transposase [Streptomyces sp. NPDC056663]|uniref:IS110 family transposase n=1 Tax=Streptomyces sp. NPDC056663 TaxID=3345899 RepID=UPI0036CBDA55
MIVVGIDSHKKTHTLVVVDQVGRRLTQLTVDATARGHRQVCAWLGEFEQVLLAIEDCRHLTRRFEADLLVSGYAVVRDRREREHPVPGGDQHVVPLAHAQQQCVAASSHS